MPKLFDRTPSLGERARRAAAVRRADTAEPATWRDPHWAERAEASAHRLAGILGIARDRITVSADPTRAEGGRAWTRLTVIDHGVYEFIAADNDPARLLCLGPCPECGNRVPLTALRHLADLGDLLEHRAGRRGGARLPLAHELAADPAHHSRCPFHRG